MSQFDDLRQRYPVFTYDAFHYALGEDDRGQVCRITYDFAIPGLAVFHPTWTFPVRRRLDDEAQRVLRELVFQLGMAETISY